MTENKTILIVEDDYDSQQLFYYLVREKYHSVTVTNVDDAKVKLKSQPIHLVILDLSLAGNEDGLILVKYMKTVDQYRDIPIIAVTAHAFETDRENCLKAGCDTFITKPVLTRKIMSKIEAMI